MWESDADLGRDLDEMVAVGAQWIRLDFNWVGIEPIKGDYKWSNTDRVVNAVTSRGLRILAILHTTPAWARAPGTDNIFYPPTDPADYADYANKTVARYSDKVKFWEIMNEPNISIFWQPKPDPAAYTTLLKLAYPAIKKADPGATVLSGGLSPAVDTADGTGVAPATFLQKIYQASTPTGRERQSRSSDRVDGAHGQTQVQRRRRPTIRGTQRHQPRGWIATAGSAASVNEPASRPASRQSATTTAGPSSPLSPLGEHYRHLVGQVRHSAGLGHRRDGRRGDLPETRRPPSLACCISLFDGTYLRSIT